MSVIYVHVHIIYVAADPVALCDVVVLLNFTYLLRSLSRVTDALPLCSRGARTASNRHVSADENSPIVATRYVFWAACMPKILSCVDPIGGGAFSTPTSQVLTVAIFSSLKQNKYSTN